MRKRFKEVSLELAQVRSCELYLVASLQRDRSNSQGIFALSEFRHAAAVHTSTSGKVRTKNSLSTTLFVPVFDTKGRLIL